MRSREIGELSGLEAATQRRRLVDALHGAIEAVAGESSVRRFLRACPPGRISHVAAVGKAAAYMAAGALAVIPPPDRALVVTKTGHRGGVRLDCDGLEYLESAHPVPDRRSLAAGEALLAFFERAPADATFLFLLSGGASSLVEALPDSIGASDLARVNAWLLGAGIDIHRMNRVRKRLSRIKGGRLAAALANRPALCLLISDVPGNDPKSIGSGPLIAHRPEDVDLHAMELPEWLTTLTSEAPPLCGPEQFDTVRSHVVASAEDARAAAAATLAQSGVTVTVHEPLLRGDAIDTGRAVAHQMLEAAPGAQIWAGETTIVLPDSPGRGGRCQSLALACAIALEGVEGVHLLAAGTDGNDGPGEDAGAVIDGATVGRGTRAGLVADESLRRADAGSFLEASGDLLHTGPTGTNVMDLLIGLKA